MNDGVQFPVAGAPGAGEAAAIAPGVRWLRMRLPFALDHINLWLIEDGDGWAVVDTGYALDETKAAWEHVFAEQLGGRPVTRVFVTHYHPDHIGLADWIGARWHAPLWTSEKEWLHARMLTGEREGGLAPLRADFARRAGLDPAASALFAQHHEGYRRGVPAVPASFHRLSDGMAVTIGGREWRVVIGEGHAPELACLYCPETGVLISGDQILPKISPNVSVQAHEPDGNPLGLFLRSLDKIRDAVPAETLVLPSHNLPFYGLHFRIDQLASHHAARCDEIVAGCERPHSAAELVPLLFRRPLDSHQMVFALGEALAHLNYLAAAGELVSERGDDGVERFRRGHL
ncbi:MAG: MBL fold metallo-hydrolase [Alphaproteobacteria bacterium]|nr:MBL fold metallo-hydrolase [Alphaproteobacteria bacterium]